MVSSGNDWISARSSNAGAEPARVDAVDGDVGARRRGNHVARRIHHDRRFGVAAVVDRHDVVDVVVDAFAEQHHRLAAAADVAEVLREVADRVERVARLEAALLVVQVARRIALDGRCRRAGCTSSILFSVDERSLRPMNLSTACSSSRGLLVKSWPASTAPAGVDHRGDVVGADVALDELPRRELVRCERSAVVCRSSSTSR